MDRKTTARLLHEFAAASRYFRDAVYLVEKLKTEGATSVATQVELSLARQRFESARDMMIRLEGIVKAYGDNKEAA